MAASTVRGTRTRAHPKNQNSDAIFTRGTRGRGTETTQVLVPPEEIGGTGTRGKPGANPGQTRGRPRAEREERESSSSSESFNLSNWSACVAGLLARAAPSMSDVELRQLLGGQQEAMALCGQLAEVADGVALLLNCDADAGSFGEPVATSKLLWIVTAVARQAHAHLRLSSYAELLLDERQRGQAEKFGADGPSPGAPHGARGGLK